LKYNHPDLNLTSSEEAKLISYHWPDNIRELENIMERAVLLSDGKYPALNIPIGEQTFVKNPFEDMPTLEEMQRRYIKYVLNKFALHIQV
jgi:Response regulator containing CheY-like receiver, AAA-type ATPase, and DNA-binding domains